MIKLGVIGYGYWGPNLVRNFYKCPDCEVVAIADQDQGRREQAKTLHRGVTVLDDGYQLLADPTVDAIAIATPVMTHYPLASKALENGKHVLLEKPLTGSVAEAEALLKMAREKKRVLMVDHTFIYTGAVRKLREIIDSGELGEILYYDSVRVNLGLFQNDLNVLWDLAPHDFSIMFYLLDKTPVRISAVGSSPIGCDNWRKESLTYVTVQFEDESLAHFHLNWLSPVKVRKTLIGGSGKMVVYDGLDPDNQIKIYDCGVSLGNGDRHRMLAQYRTGDLLAPKVDQTEALEGVCREFLGAIQAGVRPLTDGEAGLQVVRLLEAAQESMMREDGSSVPVDGFCKEDLSRLRRTALTQSVNQVPSL